MSEDHDDHIPSQPSDERETPQARPSEMRLRPERAPVTRLSRKVLLGLGGVAAIAIAGALFFALTRPSQPGGSELYNTANRSTPEGLSNLPRDYTGLPRAPKLGPPLPGDLGKPMLNAGVTPTGLPTPGLNPGTQNLAQGQDAARTSHLFATTNAAQAAAPSLPATAPATDAAAAPTPASANGADAP